MIPSLIDALIGCWHSNFSFPITRTVGREKQTYVCCLECGCEFAYCLTSMRVSHKLPRAIITYPDSHTGNTLGELTEQVERTR